MKESIGDIDISYYVDCPHCSETNYSDSGEEWGSLEYGDGLPHGVLKCDNCEEDFQMSIN